MGADNEERTKNQTGVWGVNKERGTHIEKERKKRPDDSLRGPPPWQKMVN